jgi:hypothetical protein
VGLWDQVLPFDITLDGTNEVGAASTRKIFGVEVLNEGSGVSMDDALPRCRRRSSPAARNPFRGLRPQREAGRRESSGC